MPPDLDARLLAAHAADDRQSLIALYTEASDQAASAAARNFYLTHAYVYALEEAHPDVGRLRERLVAWGAEEPE